MIMRSTFALVILLLCSSSPALAVVVFKDTFTGPAGPLTAHTPDINPANGAWTYSDGSFPQSQTDFIFNLDGSGNLGFVVPITTSVFIDLEPGSFTNKIVTFTFSIDLVGNGGRFMMGFGNDQFRGIDQRSVGPVVAVDSDATMTIFNPGSLTTTAFVVNPVLNQVNDFSTVSVAINTSNNTFKVTGDHDDPAFREFTGTLDPTNIYANFLDPAPSGIVEYDYLYLQYNGLGFPRIDQLIVDVSDIQAGVFGDYNNSGVVDAADYTAWRDNLGASLTLPNEDPSVTPGQVTAEDYGVWASRFGQSAALVAATAVPEPTAMLLICSSVLLGIYPVRRHRFGD